MSWQSLFEAKLPFNTLERMAQPDCADDLLRAVVQVEPEIYWYAGSGGDLMPLNLDLPGNSTRRRLFPLSGSQQGRPLLLWMNDYADHHWSFPDHHGAEQNPRRYLIPVEGSAGIPIAVFQARIANQVNGHERPPDGDTYTVIYSAAESRDLLQHVFVEHQLPVRVVALINQGGFALQAAHFVHDDHFEQYTGIPLVLRAAEPDVGRVQAYIVDHARDNYIQIPGYQATGHVFPDWGNNGTRLWVLDPTSDHWG